MDRAPSAKKSTEMGEKKEGLSLSSSPKRTPLKTLNLHKLDKASIHLNWKQKLRESCYRRVREDRARLLWKMRSNSDQACTDDNKEFVKNAFQGIVSDELKKIKDVSSGGDILTGTDDMLWEYDGLHTAYEGDCEDILLDMQRIFYEDLKKDPRGRENAGVWVDEEDEYLARAVFEHMQLNDEKVRKEKIWCPICKKGEVKENSQMIYCNLCQFQLRRGDEVNLSLLRTRLAEAHEEHLDRGCRSKPEFCIEAIFDITALYIQCQNCTTFEVVM